MKQNPRLNCVLYVLLTAFLSFLIPLSASTLLSGFAEQEIVVGLNPTAMELVPDGSGRFFVLEKSGAVRVVKNDVLLPTPFITVPADSTNERGLCGIAFHPDYATDPNNRWVYLYYTAQTASGVSGAATNTRLVRVKASATNPDVSDGTAPVTLLDLSPLLSSNTIHMGGSMFFLGGKLFLCTGDGGDQNRSQRTDNLMGKVLRLNADGSIPTDNPFYTSLTGEFRRIYAIGLRNPFSFGLQKSTNKVYINDVGGNAPEAFESIEELTAGANYGWYGIARQIQPGQTAPVVGSFVYKDPLHTFPDTSHGNNDAITGGVFYNPETTVVGSGRFPSATYDGLYFFGNYVRGELKTYNPSSEQILPFLTNGDRPLTLKITPAGTFYMLTRGPISGGGGEGNNTGVGNGSLWKITYTGNGMPTIATQPQNKLVSVGASASFTVGVSGTAPFEYRWQKNNVNITGGTTSSSALTNTFTFTNAQASDSGAKFKCIITNSAGTVTSEEKTLTVTNNPPPDATILTPSNLSIYSGGQTINFSGSATDSIDSTIPPANLTWSVRSEHGGADAHPHPIIDSLTGSSGSFTVSTLEHTTLLSYVITLTAKNSSGLTDTVSHTINPKIVEVAYTSEPTGLKFKLGGASYTTPFTYQGVAGIVNELDVVSPQALNGNIYSFDSWSNGGTKLQSSFTNPQSNSKMAVWFKKESTGGIARDIWSNVQGTMITNLTSLSTYPNSPSISEVVSDFSSLVDYSDNYGARFRGKIKAPASGEYVFHLSASDEAQLKLNTSSTPGDEIANPPTIATIASSLPDGYEGFNYATGSLVGKGIVTSGWSGAWTDNGNVVTPGMAYTDSAGIALPNAVNGVSVDGHNAFRARTETKNSDTLWFSFIGKSSGLAAGYAGVSLFNGTNEQLFIGKRNDVSFWGIERGASTANTNVLSGSNTFIVCRVDFTLGTNSSSNVYMWLNPKLGAANEPLPTLTAATLLNCPAITFNNLRIAAGGASGPFLVDELRIGSTYAKVAPNSSVITNANSIPITLSQGQLYYVEALHKAGNGSDNFSVKWTGPGVAANSTITGSALTPLYTAPPLNDFKGWRQTHFAGSMANESKSGFNGSFTGDGISNGLKYALGMNPKIGANMANMPKGTVAGGVLSLSYRRDNSLLGTEGIEYQVEASTGLGSGTWTTTGITHEVVPISGSVDQVKSYITNGTATKRFLRLKIVEK